MFEPAAGDPFVLHPGEFVLGATLERVELPDDLAGRLEGKSSLGRLGLLTHSTAGFIDPGFGGHITLELSNVANLPITLWPGMKIGQLCLFRLSSPAEAPYGSASTGSKYQGQRGPTASKAYLNCRCPAVAVHPEVSRTSRAPPSVSLMRMTVFGTGYLGATHAACMAELGHDVLGVDVDETKRDRLRRGEFPFYEPG